MIVDSYIVPQCVVGPRSFGGLMALYESNFIKLHMLIGATVRKGDYRVSVSPADYELHLSVESSSRYTRILRLTYLFDEDGDLVADPDLVVRVYLDARMVEVAGWAEQHRHAMLRELAARYVGELGRRWSNNMMLSKWLDYLLDAGHHFASEHEEAAGIRARAASGLSCDFI